MYLFNITTLITLAALTVSGQAPAQTTPIPPADLQFFGDVWIPGYALKATNSTVKDPKLFTKMKPYLDSSALNIINFEGDASPALIPYEYKKYLLKMPTALPQLLANANIHVATLANNHAMDYGFQGLFATRAALEKAGITTVGAGRNMYSATKPELFTVKDRTVCLLAFSRTLPASFWAKEAKSGTSNLNFTATGRAIRDCAEEGHFTVVTYHWGQELTHTPKAYQKKLAHLSIKEGADVVIGHHPHTLQSIEWYEGKPIFYSLGNFAFASAPLAKGQQGMAVRVRFPKKAKDKVAYDLLPLNVNNDDVHFTPEPWSGEEKDPVADMLQPGLPCKKISKTAYWTCS